MLSFALTALAVVGAVAFRRVWLSKLRAQHSRALALEQLADSQRRRAQAERLALVGRLAAGVAHEINNPISYVKANVLSVRDEALSLDARQALEEALQGIDRMGQIVSDMRGLARDGQEPPAVFSADEVLGEVPVVGQPWTVPPFQLTEKDGYLSVDDERLTLAISLLRPTERCATTSRACRRRSASTGPVCTQDPRGVGQSGRSLSRERISGPH